MNQLEDLREWLTAKIDGGEEMRGEDGLVSDFICQIDAATAELADLKQRLLPQYIGRAERAEKERQMAVVERDAMLEQLIEARSATEETAIGHARYEYLRTLNPREFAALYNEALHGTADNFDDLVDRRRMKGEPDRPDWAQQLPGAEIFDRAARGDHGYDRTASLSAGRYVCTCGGACSRPDASQPSPTTKEQP